MLLVAALRQWGSTTSTDLKWLSRPLTQRGVNGTKIEFVTGDDKFKPDVSSYHGKGTGDEGGWISFSGTISSLDHSPYQILRAKKEKIPFLLQAKAKKITGEKGHRYIFQIDDNTYMSGKASPRSSIKPYVKYWIMGDDMVRPCNHQRSLG